MNHNKILNIIKSNKEIILYLFFGICTTLINTICYLILFNITNNNFLSTLIAWIVAVLFAFITNKNYVFESKCKNKKGMMSEFISFFSCRVLTGILDIMIMIVAVDYFKMNNLIWKLISNIIVTIINYIASKFIIFKN